MRLNTTTRSLRPQTSVEMFAGNASLARKKASSPTVIFNAAPDAEISLDESFEFRVLSFEFSASLNLNFEISDLKFEI